MTAPRTARHYPVGTRVRHNHLGTGTVAINGMGEHVVQWDGRDVRYGSPYTRVWAVAS